MFGRVTLIKRAIARRLDVSRLWSAIVGRPIRFLAELFEFGGRKPLWDFECRFAALKNPLYFVQKPDPGFICTVGASEEGHTLFSRSKALVYAARVRNAQVGAGNKAAKQPSTIWLSRNFKPPVQPILVTRDKLFRQVFFHPYL